VAESGAITALVIVLPGGRSVPIEDTLTIGRGDDVTLRIDDRSVSRLHARIRPTADGPVIEDAGSSYGVIVAGQRLTEPCPLVPGMEIKLGNVILRVEAATPAASAVPVGAVPPAALPENPNATIRVPINATQMGLTSPAISGDGAMRPRVRSGWALKRLEGDPGDVRYVLHDMRSGAFLRLDAPDAELFKLLDGKRTIAELLVAASETVGPAGPGRLARLLADCGERGLLDGVAPTPRDEPNPGLLQRAFGSKEVVFGWIPGYFERAYRRWGRVYFSPLAVTGLVLLSLSGLVVFSYLIGARYGTPLIVAHRLVIGGLVFIIGRFMLVAIHELAHGLALRRYGRNTDRAGLRLIAIFPYAFVDTSQAYFEPRKHRMAISAAGPASDFALGALFSIVCAVAPPGNLRAVFFTLAFAAYIGAFFNANPFLDRDGYQILSEWLREPHLRQRARAQLKERLSGQITGEQGSPVLARYAVAGLIWSLVGAGFMIVISLRYYKVLERFAPHAVITGGFAAFFILLLLPIPFALGAPLIRRARFGTPEVNRVVR
jgi:putative peptide zinc metalloprotease protein